MSDYFKEKEGFSPIMAIEEASRCLLCLDAPCSKSCPANTDPAKFIRSLRFKNIEGAIYTIRVNNPLAGICARVCPTEKYCENGCLRSGIDKPIQIGMIQRFLTDYEANANIKTFDMPTPNGKKVAIIGSGPSGLSAARELALMGFSVTIYDKNGEAGGYLRYGIPEYRLPKAVLFKEINDIFDLGIKYIPYTNIGIDKKLEELQQENDAVILSIGFSKGKMLDMFKEKNNIITAVDFLKDVKEKNGKIKIPKSALIIGGGDVALDCATTLKKLGCRNVTDIAYEEFYEFKASMQELEIARNNNVSIIDGYIPTNINNSGVVEFEHRIIKSKIKIKAQLIILAIGQISNFDGLNINQSDIDINNCQIKNTNLFYAGDLMTKDKTVVHAVNSGKLVAKEIYKYLMGGELK